MYKPLKSCNKNFKSGFSNFMYTQDTKHQIPSQTKSKKAFTSKKKLCLLELEILIRSFSIKQQKFLESIMYYFYRYKAAYMTQTTLASIINVARGTANINLHKLEERTFGLIFNIENRGSNRTCLYHVNEDVYELMDLLSEDTIIFNRCLKYRDGYISKTLRFVSSMLPMLPVYSFRKFSENALSNGYAKIMYIMKGCLVGPIKNISGYLYVYCMNYHQDNNIPLLE